MYASLVSCTNSCLYRIRTDILYLVKSIFQYLLNELLFLLDPDRYFIVMAVIFASFTAAVLFLRDTRKLVAEETRKRTEQQPVAEETRQRTQQRTEQQQRYHNISLRVGVFISLSLSLSLSLPLLAEKDGRGQGGGKVKSALEGLFE